MEKLEELEISGARLEEVAVCTFENLASWNKRDLSPSDQTDPERAV